MCVQVLGEAPKVNSTLPIDPLDSRHCRLKQEDSTDMHNGSREADYQVTCLCPFLGCLPLALSGPLLSP